MSKNSARNTSPTTDLTLFQDRRFLLLWLAQVISSLGDWALLVVLPVTLYNASGSKLALGLAMIAGTLPVLLFGLIGGVYADRWNRRRTMIAADLGRALAILLLLGIANSRHFGPHDLAAFYGVAFLVASFSCFFSPARVGLMTTLLPREKLLQANALTLSGMQLTMLLGPALGGLLVAWAHPRGAFIFDAATFAASAILVSLIANVPTVVGTKAARGLAGVWADAGDGLRFVWGSPILRPTLILLSVAVIGGNVINTLEFAFVRDIWHGTGRQFGFIVSCIGLAALLTSLLGASAMKSAPPARLMLPGFFVMALADLLISLSHNLYAGAGLLFVSGIGNALVNLALATLFQMTAPNEIQGRVSATISLVNRLAMTLGSMLAALLAVRYPATAALRPIFGGVAGMLLLCGLLVWPLLGRAKSPQPTETLLLPQVAPAEN